MELYEEILLHALKSGQMGGSSFDCKAIVESACYRALEQIKAVLEDERLDDPACFLKIEEIVCILENLGSSAGFRHDFG